MYEISIQRAFKASAVPSSKKLKSWAAAALQNKISSAELTIRIVDKSEIQELNSRYRNKDYPTNVLSFPLEIPVEVQDAHPLIGDIVICAEIIKEEAKKQKKTEEAHWAHMVIHGALHLLGYDHQQNDEAEKMETEEIRILQSLGFANPY